MYRLVSIIALATLVGCGGKDDDDTSAGADVGEGATPGCEVDEVSPAYPEADGAEFYYRGSVEFVFDGIDEDATITLADAAGTAVDGSTSWMDNKLSFTPSAPLAPSTQYSTTLTHCGGESTIGFITGSLGGPLDEGVDLVGNTYVVNLDDANFVKPAGVGGLLLGLLEQHILLGVTEVTDTEIKMMGAISKDKPSTDQDTCDPSISFPAGADFTTAPFFSIGPETTSLSVAGISVNINDLMFAGDFASDGTYIGGAILSGLLDAAELAGVLVDNGLIEEEDPSAVCDLIATFGVACEDCGDGRAECLSIYVDRITAEETGTALIEVETCDVDTCEGGCAE